ncbi:MAG: tetratricopeptide repeat protein [Terriglobia bacterium]
MRNHAGTGLMVVLLAFWALAGATAQEKQEPQEPQPFGQQTQGPGDERADLQKIMQAGSPRQRLALIEKFLEQYPDSQYLGLAYSAAAQAYRRQNKFAQAVKYGEMALELSPNDVFSLILVADSLAESALPTQDDFQEKLTRAEDFARRALEVMPDLFANMPRRPEVPEEEYEKEMKMLEAQPHATLGFIHLRRNQFGEAETELQQAIELTQPSPNAHDYERLGIVEMRQKKYKDAGAAFQRCIEIDTSAATSCRKRLERIERILKVTGGQESQPQE